MLHITNPVSSERRTLPAETLSTGSLAALVREIAAACDGPAESMHGCVTAALVAAAVDPALVTADQCKPHVESYARHILYGAPGGRFTVVALVWGSGQFSPPHAHHAWCAYGVRTGVLSETLFAFDTAAAAARPLRVARRLAGYACFAPAGLDQIHRLGNAGAEPAMSIHVYGVARERIATHVNRIVPVAPAEDER